MSGLLYQEDTHTRSFHPLKYSHCRSYKEQRHKHLPTHPTRPFVRKLTSCYNDLTHLTQPPGVSFTTVTSKPTLLSLHTAASVLTGVRATLANISTVVVTVVDTFWTHTRVPHS
eukprot:TRINITY_DN5909_c0_g1_i1.p1 TRINITY_DN5909_c0_g1~~TRINITY_DN5909_c0_g1_i1.p1  ORF type:complete len:114 (+),score=16.72 TRINITY_DN5909_c0_g1_i1:117-458(+)